MAEDKTIRLPKHVEESIVEYLDKRDSYSLEGKLNLVAYIGEKMVAIYNNDFRKPGRGRTL